MTFNELRAYINSNFGSVIKAFTGGRMKTVLNDMTDKIEEGGGGDGSGGVSLGETSSTAYRGDRGATAYTHSQLTGSNPHGTTAAQVGAAAASHTHSASNITDFNTAALLAAPAETGAGIKAKLELLSGTERLDASAIKNLPTGGGGGTVDSVNGQTGIVSLTQDNVSDGSTYKQFSLTEKTKLGTIATSATQNIADATSAALMDSKNVAERSATVTLTNKTLTAPVLSGTITGTYTLGGTPTLPSSVVTLTGTQTLTNKTFTAPVGIAKGDVGLGNVDNTSNATERSAAATLTNKTISGASNAITNIAQSSVTNLVSDLASKVSLVDGVVPEENLPGIEFADSDFTVTGTTDKTIEIKVSRIEAIASAFSGGSVTLTGTQTLTNKTLTSPVINTPTGIVKGDVGLGNVDNTSNATERAATATLTNKTLTAPIISTISNTGTLTLPTTTGTLALQSEAKAEIISIAMSDLTTAITTGTSKAYFRMPWAGTLTAVKATCLTAPTGSTIIIDVNEAGTTVLSTKLSIDASEKTSTTAASAAVISDAALADDAEITLDFDQVGSTIAGAGVIVYLFITRA